MLGKIHSFETLGAADGPGIRFVVFMQGCNFRCKYCQNRDTWDIKMGKEYSVEEIVKRIERCKNYIEASHGGVTVSGGEPLLQVDFLIELFTELKKRNIHTAIDTSGGVVITEKIKELLKLTDLVLLDIKHIDDKKCKELTGFSNKQELEFARYCSDNNIKLWIRQVLLTGYTDDKEDLIKTQEFISTLKTVERVEVLPYHNLGKAKWEEMHDEYQIPDSAIPTEEHLEYAKYILNKGITNNNN